MTSDNDFLMKEYELCYEQLRFYDERHSQTLKYLITLTTSVSTALLAIYKVFGDFDYAFYKAQAILSSVVFLASIILYCLMLQNRIYFVKVAKQLNALRKYFCERSPDFGNQLWLSTKIPTFRVFSVHFFQMLGVVVLASIFSTLSFHSTCYLFNQNVKVCNSIYFFLVLVILLIGLGVGYLKIIGRQSK